MCFHYKIYTGANLFSSLLMIERKSTLQISRNIWISTRWIVVVVAHGIWNMRFRTTLTFWIKKFRSVITVAHGMLGNAIQALERSIVTITFSVKKEEEEGGV